MSITAKMNFAVSIKRIKTIVENKVAAVNRDRRKDSRRRRLRLFDGRRRFVYTPSLRRGVKINQKQRNNRQNAFKTQSNSI